MRQNRTTSDRRPIIAVFLTAGMLVGQFAHADDRADSSKAGKKLPPFSAVKTTVERTLATDPDYRAGDLVSQRQVATALGELKKVGWEVEQSRKLLARVPAEGEFLVRALRTPRGVPFMRQVSALPGGFERVDRLSRLPNGQQTVQKLIEGPDGHKLIGYLAEARGGREMGKMLGGTAQGADFNEATGRIYTSKQLLVELEKLHAVAAKSAAK
jgi:hypothetical protein